MRGKIQDEVKRAFNPEFINRLDEIVVFRQWNREDVVKIIDIVLDETLHKLSDREISIELSKTAKDFLAEKGFDPVFGARPLRRAIQRYMEDPLAEELLRGRFSDKSKIKVKKKANQLDFAETKKQPSGADSPK